MFLALQCAQICIRDERTPHPRVSSRGTGTCEAGAVAVGDLICPRCRARTVSGASACWRCGEPLATLERPSTQPGSERTGSEPVMPLRRHGHLGIAIALALALAAFAGAVVYVLGTGRLPEQAAGFTLVESRSLDAGVIFGPPVSNRDDLTVVPHRIGVYIHDDGVVEVRVVEMDVTGFTIPELLEAQLVDRRTERWTTTRIGGVAYTCGGHRLARWCFWATSSHFGRTGTVEPGLAEPDTSIASLRRLAVAIHDAVS